MNFNLLTATQTIERSMGFVLNRFLIYLAVGGAVILSTLGVAGTGFGLGSFINPNFFGGLGAVVGLLAAIYAIWKFRAFLWRTVRFPHLCLLGRILRGETVPEGRFQAAAAKEMAQQTFASGRKLWSFVSAYQKALGSLLAGAPAGSLPLGIAAVPLAVAGFLMGRWVETMLARLTPGNVGDAERLAVAEVRWLATHLKAALSNVVGVLAFEYGSVIALFLLFRIPFGEIDNALPGDFGPWPQIFALVVAWIVKAAFLEPISACALMQAREALADASSDNDHPRLDAIVEQFQADLRASESTS